MKGRVAFIPSAHKIEFHEYDVPAPAAGGIVAAVTQTNVCGSEVHMWKGEFGKRGVMPGHEMSGRIEALGAGVRTDWAECRSRKAIESRRFTTPSAIDASTASAAITPHARPR